MYEMMIKLLEPPNSDFKPESLKVINEIKMEHWESESEKKFHVLSQFKAG